MTMIRPRYLTRLLSCVLLVAAAAGFGVAGAGAAEPPLGVTDFQINAERTAAMACVIFDQPLPRRASTELAPYFTVSPPTDVSPSVRDRSFCLEGFDHGSAYTLTLKAGFPGAGAVLDEARPFELTVPDRQPLVAFTRSGTLLPRIAKTGLPVETINVESVSITVLRVHDGALVEQLRNRQVGQAVTMWEIDRLTEETGELVWQGEMAVSAPRNQAVVTAIPLDDAIGTLQPGVYVAVAQAEHESLESWDSRATQWFTVSDLGLSAYLGQDGLTVHVRALSSALPVGGATVRLISRNNQELGQATSDGDGLAVFGAGMVRGAGGLTPSVIYAQGGSGDFSYLQLDRAGLDLSDRGVGGRLAPGPLDAFVYTERGVYRPGETANIAALLRDDGARAVTAMPLTLKLYRPDGAEADAVVVDAGGAGGYHYAWAIPESAYTGQWTVEAFVDPEAEPVGAVDVMVEDFVPPRLEFDLTPAADRLAADDVVPVTVDGRFLYGAPASNLPGEATLVVRAAPTAHAGLPDYRFGLVQEDFLSQRTELEGFFTDGDGRATIPLALDYVPDTTVPLEAALQVSLFDVGGRPVHRELVLAVDVRPFDIGIRPQFADGRVDDGAVAGFDIIAASPDGDLIDRSLTWELYRETYDYVWHRDWGQWQYEVVILDQAIAGGQVDASADGPAMVSATVNWGSYRVEVFDADSGAATSYRFWAGWGGGPSATRAPDKVAIALDRDLYQPGDTAQVLITPPFPSARLMVAIADTEVRQVLFVDADADGATLELPVSADWTAGTYVIATAFAPAGEGGGTLPTRAVGVAWLALDESRHGLEVALDAAAETLPGIRFDVPVAVDGAAPGEQVMLTLAGVDDGVLQLTGALAPDPFGHYFGKRRLGVEIRDLYGDLIDASGVGLGQIRTGGDAARGRQLTGLPDPDIEVLSFFSGVLTVGDDGRVTVPIELPDFQGRMRLMAVAWSADRVGAAEATVLVRPPLVAELTLPRFLAPGDRATLHASLHNLTAPEGTYDVSVRASGAAEFLDRSAPYPVVLAQGERGSVPIDIEALAVGRAELVLEVSGPDGFALSRDWTLDVRPASAVITRREVAALGAGAEVAIPPELFDGLRAETVTGALAVSTLPQFDVAGLLGALDRYPYGCAEQTTSRALPWLYMSEVGNALGIDDFDAKAADRIRRGIRRVLTMQSADGSFGVWGPNEGIYGWLNAYVMDFLTRARGEGHLVPDGPYTRGLDWLARYVEADYEGTGDLAARAYGFAVLARAGATDLSRVRYFQATWGDLLPSALARTQIEAAMAMLGGDRLSQSRPAVLANYRRHEELTTDYGSSLRDGAAMLALALENDLVPWSELAGRAQSLVDDASQRIYTSTQENAWLLIATHAMLDGAEPLSLEVDGTPVTREGSFFSPFDSAADLWAMAVRNTGNNDLFQIVTVSGVPAAPLPPEANGIAIRRALYDGAGNRVRPGAIRQNQLLVVVIDGVVMDRTRHEALVVDLLPAGFEIENVRLSDSAQLGDFAWLEEVSRSRHVEYRDDRYVAAIDLGHEQRFRLAYLVRAVTAGRFANPAPFVEDMYHPFVFGRGAPGVVTISSQ